MSSIERLKFLLEEYSLFESNSLSERIANNLSSQSWHLIDWIFNEFKSPEEATYDFQLGQFRSTLYPLCPQLKIMHDLTQEAKHSKVSRPKATIKALRVEGGAFDQSFDRSFDISRLVIELNDGSTLDFQDTVIAVIDFWKKYFKDNLGLSVTE